MIVPGSIVEFIDRKEMISAVVLALKGTRLHMLTEKNREVTYSEKRLIFSGKQRLNPALDRTTLVDTLQAVAKRRRKLQQQINVEELWEVLHPEQTWIDLQTVAELCFDATLTEHHASAVVRAMLENRLYFKFDADRFFPNSPEKVAQIAAQAAEEARKALLIDEGSRWVKLAARNRHATIPRDKEGLVEILKSFYLFGKDSPDHKTAKEILSRAGMDPGQDLFEFLVRLGVWDEDENLNLHRFGITASFPAAVTEAASHLVKQRALAAPDQKREDLTGLDVFTIDGQGTLDFDDALSIDQTEHGFRLGVHITDLGHTLKRGGALDEEAFSRASSIYMPDARISMLPPELAENLCSLKKGQTRPAISIMAELDREGTITDYSIIPSVIRVARQLTYYEANQHLKHDPRLGLAHELARKLRKHRLEKDALQLNLPEMNIWIDDEGEISVTQVNRESPSRLMVSESMILANWLAARFFRDQGRPAVFRSQLPPRERLIDRGTGSLFQHWMQRRFLSRVILSLQAEPHAGLGLDAYVTLTSPLRKYLDLVTQRQLRAVLGLEEPYSEQELNFIIQAVKEPLSYITVLQQERTRYWILRYLERLIGEPQEALVLEKRRKRCVVLLTGFMLEASLPLDVAQDLQPEDRIMVTIEQASARTDKLVIALA